MTDNRNKFLGVSLLAPSPAPLVIEISMHAIYRIEEKTLPTLWVRILAWYDRTRRAVYLTLGSDNIRLPYLTLLRSTLLSML